MQPVRKDLKVTQGRQALPAHRVRKENSDHKVSRATPAHKDQKVIRGPLALPAHKVRRVK